MNKRKKIGLYYWQQYFSRTFPFCATHVIHTSEQLHAAGYFRNDFWQRNFWKFVYIYSGEAEFFANDRSYPIRAGSAMLVHPNTRTSFRILSSRLEQCNIVFQPEFIRTELEKLRDDFRFFTIFGKNESAARELHILNGENKLESLVRKIEKEFELQEDNCHVMLEALLTALLIQLSRHAAKAQRRSGPEVIVSYVSRLIEERFRTPLSLDKIASDVGESKSRLCHIYRKAHDSTIMDDLLQRRLAEARRLLRDSDLPVLEVCYRADFNDLSGFYRRFRQAHGCTPQKYREQSPE